MFDMNEPAAVEIILRIPGTWAHPRELIERLPEVYRLTGESLILPDETAIEFLPRRPDNQFAQLLRSSCRNPATADELAAVNRYTVNVCPGGSMEAARRMMHAGAAIVRAGGAGMFIDNSTLAHGGQKWLEMTEDGGPEALSFAYVGVVQGKADVWTMGMHALGLRDVIMKRADHDASDFNIIEVLRYVCRSEKPIDNGHVLADLNGPRFQIFAESAPNQLAGSPLHNPFGRLKLVSMRDIATTN
jgi:hypothetical protein